MRDSPVGSCCASVQSRGGSPSRPVERGSPRVRVVLANELAGLAKEEPMPPALILSSDSHVFEPPDLWTTRIDQAFRHRAPRMVRIDGADQLVVEEHQVLSGIGLISNAGARFEAPETISGLGRFEDVPPGGYDPQQHLADMRLEDRKSTRLIQSPCNLVCRLLL